MKSTNSSLNFAAADSAADAAIKAAMEIMKKKTPKTPPKASSYLTKRLQKFSSMSGSGMGYRQRGQSGGQPRALSRALSSGQPRGLSQPSSLSRGLSRTRPRVQLRTRPRVQLRKVDHSYPTKGKSMLYKVPSTRESTYPVLGARKIKPSALGARKGKYSGLGSGKSNPLSLLPTPDESYAQSKKYANAMKFVKPTSDASAILQARRHTKNKRKAALQQQVIKKHPKRSITASKGLGINTCAQNVRNGKLNDKNLHGELEEPPSPPANSDNLSELIGF